jgi:hypothetical protein
MLPQAMTTLRAASATSAIQAALMSSSAFQLPPWYGQ